MYLIYYSKQYRKSLKKIIKSGQYKNFNISEINNVVDKLASGRKLDAKYLGHSLTGKMSVYKECHIRADLLLIYKVVENQLVLALVNVGSHSNLFK